jgi:LCP family protein required for cell wall assembly
MKRFKNPKIIILLIVIVLIISAEINSVLPRSIKDIIKDGKPINILLLGVDARPGETNARSDTIILTSVDSTINKAVLLWVPRDTRISTPNKSKKINMVNQLQGPEESCKVVGKLLGINVDHYIVTNFAGFERIIDILGGVYMDVDINLSSYSSGIYLKKGYRRLSGEEALKYARYRGVQDGDIGRTQRQQKLLRALIKQLIRLDTIPKLPVLISALQENVQTNIKFSDLLYLANIIFKIDENDIITQTLPGYAFNDSYSGASYWEVDREVGLNIIESLFEGNKYDVKLDP